MVMRRWLASEWHAKSCNWINKVQLSKMLFSVHSLKVCKLKRRWKLVYSTKAHLLMAINWQWNGFIVSFLLFLFIVYVANVRCDLNDFRPEKKKIEVCHTLNLWYFKLGIPHQNHMVWKSICGCENISLSQSISIGI